MIKIYFGTRDNYEMIGCTEDKSTIWTIINSYIEKQNINTFYWIYRDSNPIEIDYGSHTYFFFIEGITIPQLFD